MDTNQWSELAIASRHGSPSPTSVR